MLVGVAGCSDARRKSSSLASFFGFPPATCEATCQPYQAPYRSAFLTSLTQHAFTSFTDISASPTFPLLHACHATSMPPTRPYTRSAPLELQISIPLRGSTPATHLRTIILCLLRVPTPPAHLQSSIPRCPYACNAPPEPHTYTSTSPDPQHASRAPDLLRQTPPELHPSIPSRRSAFRDIVAL